MSVMTISITEFERMKREIEELKEGACRYRCRIGNYTNEQLIREAQRRGITVRIGTDAEISAATRRAICKSQG